ncbi:MAG: hypothetical protein K0S39_5053 [Paenibacillus sp.]|jgi:hypothetical protein|nr:hypothetical protein [Paenibacillus sp.]
MLTDQAWLKLQEKLAKEPRNMRWSDLERASSAEKLAERPDRLWPQALSAEPVYEADRHTAFKETPSSVKPEPGLGQWFRKRRKWVGTVSAAALLAIVLATPAGNEALAAILHKFRMQEMTVVQKDDLQMILNGAFNDDKTRESINKFGTFTQKSGVSRNEPLSAEETKKVVNGKLLLPEDFDAAKQQFHVSPSNTITFRMNVNEVNDAMKRLGATKLMPSSVDGKPITLELGPRVHYSFGRKGEAAYWMSQQPVPEITVDPSIPISEAMEAVLEFPLLPENLKQSMQTANMLKGGSVPLPVITNQKMEQIQVEGIPVLIHKAEMGQDPNYKAYWVQNGMLIELGVGGKEVTQDTLIAKIKELIRS